MWRIIQRLENKYWENTMKWFEEYFYGNIREKDIWKKNLSLYKVIEEEIRDEIEENYII